MALCDQGYLCEVCGEDVEDITCSDLYLRYVLGEVDPETLHVAPERHILCNPTLAQFIVSPGFAPVFVEGYFGKANLDPGFVAEEEARVTRGYLRLKDVFGVEGLPITEYPLPGVMAHWRRDVTSGAGSVALVFDVIPVSESHFSPGREQSDVTKISRNDCLFGRHPQLFGCGIPDPTVLIQRPSSAVTPVTAPGVWYPDRAERGDRHRAPSADQAEARHRGEDGDHQARAISLKSGGDSA